MHDGFEAGALIRVADEHRRPAAVVLVHERRYVRRSRICGVATDRSQLAGLFEMRIATTQGVNPLGGIGGNQSELETKTIFTVIEPPLSHCAYDKKQSDPVRPDDNDVWRTTATLRRTSWETPPRAPGRRSGTH